MIDEDELPAARARLAELRHRLYRPEASEEDRREYAALQARLEEVDRPPLAEEPQATEPQEDPGPPDPPRRRRPRLVLATGLVAVVAVLAVVVGVSATNRSRSSAAPSPSSAQSAGGGPLAVPAATTTPTLAPTAVPMLDEGTAVIAQQAYGSGSAIVPLDTSAAPEDGELIVAISSSDPAPVGWRALRRQNRSDHSSYLQVVAASDAGLRQGAAAPSRTAYEGAAPSQIVVDAATGIGWRLVVEFLPPQTAGLR